MRRAVVDRQRNIVGNRDGKAAGRCIAIDVGDDQVEGDAGGIARRVVGQREGIADRARCGVEAGDRQRTGRGGDNRADRHGHAVDGRRHRAIATRKRDRAAGGLGWRGRVGAGCFAGPRGKAGFGDDGAGAAHDGNRGDDRDRIGDRDGQRSGRGRSVGIGQGVGERIAHPAWRAGVAGEAVAAVGLDRQDAILARNLKVASGIEAGVGVGGNVVAGDPGDRCIVCAERIDARRTAGGAHPGDDVAGLRGKRPGGNRIGIVARGRCVVGDVDRQRRCCSIAVGIPQNHGELVANGPADDIVGQRVGEVGGAADRVEAGDRQHAARAGEALARSGEGSPVDRERGDAIGRTEHDRSGGRLGVGRRVRPGGLAVARRQPAFGDIGGGVHRPGGVVGGDDNLHRIAVDRLRDNFKIGLGGKPELGRRQQVADRVGGLDRAGIFEEVVARTVGQPRSGLDRLGGDQQCRKVERRNRDPVDHDLGHVDRAAGNDEDLPVVERDDQILANRLDIVERGACGKDDNPVGIGDQRNPPGARRRSGGGSDLGDHLNHIGIDLGAIDLGGGVAARTGNVCVVHRPAFALRSQRPIKAAAENACGYRTGAGGRHTDRIRASSRNRPAPLRRMAV